MPDAPAPSAGTTPSLVSLIASGVMDAELGALVWLLVEARVPLVVATPVGRAAAGTQLLVGVIGSVRPDEDQGALDATLSAAGASSLIRGRRAGGVLEAASLGEIRERLGSGPLPLTPDQLTFLGCVLVLDDATGGAARRGRLRVTAAHYVRPLARDAHGHAQRLDPAVLAVWDDRLGRYEHFAWGVMPEIAARIGRRAGDLEADLHHRRDDLAGLVKGGVTKLEDVQRLVAGYRVHYGVGHDGGHGDGGHGDNGHGDNGHDDGGESEHRPH